MEKENTNLADPLKTAQETLINLEKKLELLTAKLIDIKTDENEAVDVMGNILKIIPKIRKLKCRLKFEMAFKKYKDLLISKEINNALLTHIVQKQREELSKQLYELDFKTVNKLERKLGIFDGDDEDGADIFNKFRILLSQTKEIDDIEVIIRKVKSKLDHRDGKKKSLKKEDLVRYFVDAAGFEERSAVIELLLNKTLAAAIGSRLVTEAKLTRELKKIKGDFSELSRQIIDAFNKKVNKVNEAIGSEAPVIVRIFSNYIVNPVSGTASVIGILMVILYSFGKFTIDPLSRFVPGIAEIFMATAIPDICSMLNPQAVYIAGFGSLFIGGFLKMIDERIVKNTISKNIKTEE